MKLNSREVELIEMLRQQIAGRVLVVKEDDFIRQITVMEPGDKVPKKGLTPDT